MTAVKPARRTPIGGAALLLWLLGAAVAFYLLFLLITLVLRRVPDPIGPNADLFVEAARTTLYLTVASGAIGLVVGALAGLARTSRFAPLRWVVGIYIWLIRGTPLLLQILFAYNALPLIFQALHLPVQLNDFWSAVLALSLNVGAYNAEVVRAGIQAVPRGQAEAARSLGLSGSQTMLSVVMPQALRIVVPPLVNNLIALLKDSSLASVIGILELVNQGGRIASSTFQFVPVYITLGAVYLALTTVLTLFTDQLERRVQVAGR
ncbi:amino acid ABC transporter permease [Deinococcus sonorensis]|uniref:Amino acid ABC transporter permease n=2 Tax=Deinococcus sonorensis TaxID=309891 RepID=A0AAU7UB92_9DEIO